MRSGRIHLTREAGKPKHDNVFYDNMNSYTVISYIAYEKHELFSDCLESEEQLLVLLENGQCGSENDCIPSSFP